MNETARNLGLTKTHFAVAHGMHHDRNWSSALDVANLSRIAMQKHDVFRTTVNTKNYYCLSKTIKHEYYWENTNLLLWDASKQYYGVKTGTTPTAGACLCVNFKSSCH
jgi:D-alanyl-D-alanine carboxypeptidase (penicillin-binding protein 5/6)